MPIEISQCPFGEKYQKYTVTFSNKSTISILDLGATIQSWTVPSGVDTDEKSQELVLDFETPEEYLDQSNPFFGANVGPYANRISGAKIEDLNGKTYTLEANEGPNTLHSGKVKLSAQLFTLASKRVIDSGEEDEEAAELVFKCTLPDGDFPGPVDYSIIYRLSGQSKKKQTKLGIEYHAELSTEAQVEQTVVSLTNHSYFNIGNKDTIEGTIARFCTTKFLETDSQNIPTGKILDRHPKINDMGEVIFDSDSPALDNCFVINDEKSISGVDTLARPFIKFATLNHPDTKLTLEAYTTEPAFQCYTGDGINMKKYIKRAAICLEPGRYINAVNVPKWRHMVLLSKTHSFASRLEYRITFDK